MKLACILLVPLVLAVVAPTAGANSPRVTRGDAMAILEAIGGGGATLLYSPTLEGASDQAPLARIRPFGASNGQHFCSLDWHVLGVSLGQPGPREVAVPDIEAFVVTLTLDGVLQRITTTVVKKYNPTATPVQFGVDEAYFKNFMVMLAPEDLAVGTHTAGVAFFDPVSGESDSGNITFFVDGPDEGACV
jgi:hypothetical protein